MAESKALSSLDGCSYNSLRDVQKAPTYDYMNGISQITKYKNGNRPRGPLIDTKTYLEQIEEKYNRQFKKKTNMSDSDSDLDDCNQKQVMSKVPTKFNQLNTSRLTQQQQQYKPEFNIPQHLSLSKGPSEQYAPQNNNSIIQEMHEKYISHNGSVVNSQLVDNNIKRRFFEQVIELKKNLPAQHPGQDILVAQLYCDCMRQQIPEQYWTQWISNRLQN